MMNAMTRQRRQSLLTVVLVGLASLLSTTGTVMAQEVDTPIDARLEGYGSEKVVLGDSTALMWLLLMVLAILAVGVLFKDAKRSHLD